MIQYIIAAGIGAFLGSRSKKSKKSYAEGGELKIYVDKDDEPIKVVKGLNNAKKWVLKNKRYHEEIVVEDEALDTIVVDKTDTKEDIDWLFNPTYAEGGEVGKTYSIQGVDVTYHEDSYEEGELDQFHSYYLGQSDFPYKTEFSSKKDLFDTLSDFISYADMNEEDFYVDEDTIQTSALVKFEKDSDWDEFSAPTEKEKELWRKGKMKLYSAHFVFPYEVYKKEKLDFAKGGEVDDLEYSEIYNVLQDKIDDAVEDISSTYEQAYNSQGEEVEHESRSGFIPYTDGGYQSRWFEYINILSGSGTSLPTSVLEKEMQRQVDYIYELAKDRFVEENEELVKEIGEDKVNYHDLYELGYGDEAESLSEMESDTGDDSILMDVQAMYYAPHNDRGIDSKNTIRLSGSVNLEAPYHRRGNLDDYIETEFTFNSVEELETKMDSNLKKVVGWFEGDNYRESKRELKIRRMAKGGKIDYSKRTTKDFKLGELVYDTDNKRYGTIIGIYDDSPYEVRLDSDGMQPTDWLRKLGEQGDKGTKKQLFEGVSAIERLREEYPENNYPKLINNPFYAKGGKVSQPKFLYIEVQPWNDDDYFEPFEQKYRISSFEEASKKFRNFVEENNLGASNVFKASILDIKQNPFAYVSYNGRVFTNNDKRELYDGRGGEVKEEDYLWNMDGNKYIVNSISGDMVFLDGYKRSNIPFSKAEIKMLFTKTPPNYAKGGKTRKKRKK